ncbi:MAG: sensor histidine kinase, partial [Suilimivivens sp.]
MKKQYINTIGYILLLILAGILLYHMCQTTNQAAKSIVIGAEFVGEYSIGGSAWQPLEKDTKLSSFDGDLVLRGHFSPFHPMWISFYLDHIGVMISVDGQEIYWSGRVTDEVPEMMCSSIWNGWDCSNVDAASEIEIRLHNPHNYGNGDAYNEFLGSLYIGGETALQDTVWQESKFYTVAGLFVVVISVALLGLSLGYLAQRIPAGSLLCSIGMMCLFMGGYILMDTKDICYRSSLLVFNTCVRQFCIMFSALAFADCAKKILSGKERKIAAIAVKVLSITEGILLILSLTNTVTVYDTGLYFAIVFSMVSLILLCLCISECLHNQNADKMVQGSCIVMILAVILELLNGRMNFAINGMIIKAVFLLLFAFHLIRAVRRVAVNHSASIKAEKLAEELRNSRIILAMSQIRTHFIFNVLNAISGMCKYDPEKADETIVCFARYLRSNIDIMQKDEPISFLKELEHLKDYVELEQVRFGDKIRFLTDIQTSDFLLPPLVLQPLVENSIKHGLLVKDAGGTIWLSTRQENGKITITIRDDGAGFDSDDIQSGSSVGISNVRFRLEHIMRGRLEIDSRKGQGTTVT